MKWRRFIRPRIFIALGVFAGLLPISIWYVRANFPFAIWQSVPPPPELVAKLVGIRGHYAEAIPDIVIATAAGGLYTRDCCTDDAAWQPLSTSEEPYRLECYGAGTNYYQPLFTNLPVSIVDCIQVIYSWEYEPSGLLVAMLRDGSLWYRRDRKSVV